MAGTTAALGFALGPVAMVVIAGGMSSLPKWFLPVTITGLLLSILCIVAWLDWAPRSGLEFWGWASSAVAGYVGLLAVLAMAVAVKRRPAV